MDVPEDDESTANDPFSDASDFEPKGYAFAKGGEVGKPRLGKGGMFAALKGKLGKERLAAGGVAGKPSFAARMATKYRSMHR